MGLKGKGKASKLTLNFRLVCLRGKQCHPLTQATLGKEMLVEGDESKPGFGHIKSAVVTTMSVGTSSAQL